MKQLIALTLLLGYLLLVPVCFLSAPLAHDAHQGGSTHMAMMGMSMNETAQGETGASPISAVGEHLAMYLSVTGATHASSGEAFLLMIVVVAVAFAVVFFAVRFPSLITSAWEKRKWRELRALVLHQLLRWLSRTLYSPPHVYALAYARHNR